ncbi:hypothetical protein TKK_0002276 [Trichogramma kaykai]
MVGNRLLGPVFCDSAFNGESYLEFLNIDFTEMLDENFTREQQRDLVLMLDGAPAHWAGPVLDYLDEHWTQRWIGRYGLVAWPPSSPDLNPLDYSHWGPSKDQVYHHGAPDSVEELDYINGLINSLHTRFKAIFAIEGVGKTAAIALLSHPSIKKDWVHCLSMDAQKNIENLIQKTSQSPEEEVATTGSSKRFFFGKAAEPTNLGKIISLKTSCNELLRFLAEPVTDDLLELNRYIAVKKLFLKYNTLIPSSAPVERLFSYATLLNVPKYNRLSDDQFDNRLLSKVNLKKHDI